MWKSFWNAKIAKIRTMHVQKSTNGAFVILVAFVVGFMKMSRSFVAKAMIIFALIVKRSVRNAT